MQRIIAVLPSVLVCISIILFCSRCSLGSKYDLEGDWRGKTLPVLQEEGSFEKQNQEVPLQSTQIECHFWLDGKQILFTFVDLDTNETSSGNYTVDDNPTPHSITFQHTSGPNAGAISYGIYQVDTETVPPTTYLAIAHPGLPLRPVNFQPNQYVTVMQGTQLNTPMQVHLAFGPDPVSSMVVTWITHAPTPTSEVQFGLSAGHYSASATGAWSRYTYKKYTSPSIHKVNLSGLKPGSTYYYRVGDHASGYSKEFNFRMPEDTNKKVTVTIYGDMNLGGSVGGNSTIWADSLDVLDLVLRQEQKNDFLLHVGDVAYCLGNQTCWDHFFQDVQPIASHMPYMVCFGNHDVYPEPFGYTNRFTMPGPYSSNFQDGDYFYSFDLGPVHFVGFSTELWFLPVNATVNLTQQMDWVTNDLKVANQPANRKVRPWIVAFGHRPIYCSVENYPDCQNGVALELQRQMEPLFVQNGVDIAVFGHIHSMERSYPLSYDATICGDYENPCGTVHIVNGAAGQPFLGPPYPKPDWSAFRNHTHGYARMTATLTNLQWDFVSKDTGEVIDTFTLGNPFQGGSKNWGSPIAQQINKRTKKIHIEADEEPQN